MDREMVRQHLEMAERHVSEGLRHVLQQRELVEKLHCNGHDTREANTLLCRFEDLLELHIKDRNRLRKELASSP